MDDRVPPEPPVTSREALTGFPSFEHNQYTVEGEIERIQAFGQAGATARGWRRTAAVVMALGLLVTSSLVVLSAVVVASTK